MSLSRKRKRELNKLRSQAEALLDEQREILGHAGLLAQEAGRQAKHLGNEVVAPRVNEALEGVRPSIDRGVQSARRASNQARLFVAPLLASALASTDGEHLAETELLLRCLQQTLLHSECLNLSGRIAVLHALEAAHGARKSAC